MTSISRCFRKWICADMVPSHFIKQCWLILAMGLNEETLAEASPSSLSVFICWYTTSANMLTTVSCTYSQGVFLEIMVLWAAITSKSLQGHYRVLWANNPGNMEENMYTIVKKVLIYEIWLDRKYKYNECCNVGILLVRPAFDFMRILLNEREPWSFGYTCTCIECLWFYV